MSRDLRNLLLLKDSFSKKNWLPVVAVIVMSVIYCHRLLFVKSGQVLAGYDMGYIHYYWVYFKKFCYLNKTLPLWNPYVFGGYPHAAFPETAAFYIPDIIFLAMPLESAVNWSVAAHLSLAGIFTYLFCREIKLQKSASVIGAIVFMLNGYFILRLSVGHIGIIRTSCYLPVVFYFIERGLGRKDWKSYLWGSLALALQILCGHSQFYYYTILFLASYVMIRAFFLDDLRSRKQIILSRLLMLSSVITIAALR